MRVGGWIAGILPCLLLVMSGVMKLLKPAPVVHGFEQYGFALSALLPLGIVELLCTAIYLIPRTAVFGAILLTGYLGGATAANFRIGLSTLWMPVLMGVLLWTGLWMRDLRLRTLLPLRRPV